MRGVFFYFFLILHINDIKHMFIYRDNSFCLKYFMMKCEPGPPVITAFWNNLVFLWD